MVLIHKSLVWNKNIWCRRRPYSGKFSSGEGAYSMILVASIIIKYAQDQLEDILAGKIPRR